MGNTEDSNITAISSLADFNEIINRDEVSIFDFWAEWCGPCLQISPEFAKLSKEFGSVKFYNVDIEADGAAAIAQAAQVTAMPTFLVFKGGQRKGKVVGVDRPGLRTLIEANATST